MPESGEILSFLVRIVLRAVGLMWVIGAGFTLWSLRSTSMIDRMTRELEDLAEGLSEEAGASADEIAARTWERRDNSRRTVLLALQSLVLFVAGAGLLLLAQWSVAGVAALVAAQGGYFLWREHVARRAPTAELAEGARPSDSTVRAAWFSVGILCLTALAFWTGLLE